MKTDSLRLIYVYFHSIIDYGLIPWDGAYNKQLC